MLTRNPDREWERFGREDPYYGVLSDERFRRTRLDDRALDSFFASGQVHVDFVLETIRERLAPGFSPRRALDFGCGVGRCTIPLARASSAVVAVDVSDAMLREAAANCAERSLANVRFERVDEALSGFAGPFDLIHSFLVFQHIPRARGERILAQLVERLAPDGVAVLQFVFDRRSGPMVRSLGWLRKRVPLAHGLANLVLRKSFRDPLMEKNVYDLNRVLGVLLDRRCGNVHVRLHGSEELKSAIVFFQRRPDMVPHDTCRAGGHGKESARASGG